MSNNLEADFSSARENFSNQNFASAHRLSWHVNENIEHCFATEIRGDFSSAKYSIIVLSYIHSDDVEQMLRDLLPYSEDPNYELIIVDNGNPEIWRFINKLFSRFKYLKTEFNLGCPGGRNVGLQAITGKYVLFIDDDGRLEPGSIEVLVSCIETYQAVSVRGRVKALTEGGIVGTHYYKGDAITESCLLYTSPSPRDS